MSPATAEPGPRQRRPMIERRVLMAFRRRRFVLAAAEIAHEFGRPGITTTTICRIAHTARNTFYDTFENVDDCLRCGAAEACEELFAPVLEADLEGEWPVEVERGIAGLYAAVAAEPLLAELLFVHSFSLGDGGGEGYERGVDAVERLLAPGRPLAESLGHQPPALTPELAARAVVALAALKVFQGRAAELPAEAAPMADLAAGALLAAAAAASKSRQPSVG